MNNAFFKLHLSVVLAGFTGVFGKLITLNEGLLVWYRLLLTSFILFAILRLGGRLRKSSLRDVLSAGGAGLLLALHWVCFYGSIKASNVSIGVVCFSTVGFFTALLEPLFYKRRVSIRELAFSLITIAGVGLIFHFDARYRLGIAVGVLGAALAALFTVCNKRVSAGRDTLNTLLYEMLGGAVGSSLLLPVLSCIDGAFPCPSPACGPYSCFCCSPCSARCFCTFCKYRCCAVFPPSP